MWALLIVILAIIILLPIGEALCSMTWRDFLAGGVVVLKFCLLMPLVLGATFGAYWIANLIIN